MPTPPVNFSADPGANDGQERMVGRLSAMMFLQYWPLGLWAVTVGTYIAANTGDQGRGIFSPGFAGYSGSAGAIGSLLSPVVFGWVADRWMSAERVLLLLHAGCGLALWGIYTAENQTAFWIGLLVYFHFYLPTISITNTIALRLLSDTDRDFFRVRFFGTIAWISAGLFIGFFCPWLFGESIEPTRTPIALAGYSHLLMVFYCLSLPHTPPPQRGLEKSQRTGLANRALLANGTFVLFLVVSFLACVPTQSYNFANLFLNNKQYSGAAGLLTIGQLSEALCMLVMPALLARFGLWRLFLVGVIGWGIRYVLLAYGSAGDASSIAHAALVFTAIGIHGPCYVFVYVTGQLYIDRMVEPESRGAAQGWHTIATAGLGHLGGAFLAGWGQAAFLTPAGVEPAPYRWFEFWMLPVAFSAIAVVIFLLTSSGKAARRPTPTDIPAEDLPPSPADALTEPPGA